MKKSWLTAVSVVGALSTGSAVVMAGTVINSGSSPQTAAPVPELTAPQTSVYQVGNAARISLSSAGGIITVISATPDAGWSVVSTSPAAPSVAVTLTDNTQVVTFAASMVNGEVQTTVSAALVGAPPIPATPPTAAPTQSRTADAASTTSPSTTTPGASSGTWDDDDDEDDDDDDDEDDEDDDDGDDDNDD